MSKSLNLAAEIKAQSLALRLRLLRERTRLLKHGWAAPTIAELLRRPTQLEIPMMCCRFLRPEKATTLVDVGANTGYWAETFRRLVRPATYIGIEPDPRAFQSLATRFPGDKVVQAAAGARMGQMTLNLMSDSVYSTVGTYEPSGPIRTAVVRQALVDVVTIDSLAIPDGQLVVKVDVQGFEGDVLRGATKVLDRAEVVILESPLWPQTEHDNDLGFLASLLRAHDLSPVYFGLPGLSADTATIPVEYDVIFVRPDRRQMA